jgi:hypothetical protein
LEISVSLSQVQIIRSLGEALAWFEKELAWGVQPAELNHLTGRIGELYAAMITRGQMALAVNQRGYDVVSVDGARISVKTVTTSTQVGIRKGTFQHVDRVLVLRINTDETEASIEELLDCPADRITEFTSDTPDAYVFRVNSSTRATRAVDDMAATAEGHFGPHRILQYENGTIAVETDGVRQPVAKPILREIAAQIGVSLNNGNGNPSNTRQLGGEILSVLRDRGA